MNETTVPDYKSTLPNLTFAEICRFEVATGQHTIPNDEALDKFLRHETEIDRV
jgi:hypothetical protein